MTYATGAELASWLCVDPEPEMTLAVEAASRAVDRACARRFAKTDVAQSRWYRAEFWRDRWYVEIDDLMDDGLTVEVDNGDSTFGAITGYRLFPRNAAVNGRPWTRIEVLPSSPVQPAGGDVRVTACWGWDAAPEAIKLATLIQAGRWHSRRDAVGGTLTTYEVDDIRQSWASAQAHDLDSDVLGSIAAYRRLWVAA